jgi:D-psicose/D-tagatose/L-ribulose 3-epimerase
MEQGSSLRFTARPVSEALADRNLARTIAADPRYRSPLTRNLTMKIGMNLLLWTGHVTEEHFPLFRQLRAAGFDGVEIPVFDVSDQGHYRTIGRAAHDAGLECTAVALLPDEAHNAISPVASNRQGAIDHLRAAIDCAHELAASVLMGPYFQVLGQFTGEGPTDIELQHAAEVHRVIAPLAHAAGMRCALEPLNRFEAHLLNTMEQAARYVERVNHANFGATHDTFHAHIEEQDPVTSIATLHATGKLFHVHISENDRGTPGKGHAKLRESIVALRQLRYDGWLTIEAFGSAVPGLSAATRVWRPFFADRADVYRGGIALIRDSWEASAPR